MAEAELKDLPDTETVTETVTEEAAEGDGGTTVAGEEKEETIVSFGDDDPEKDQDQDKTDNTWVKDLRKKNREQAQHIQDLEKVAAESQVQQSPLGERPTLEDEDINFDAQLFEQRLTEWLGNKSQLDNQAWQQQEFEKEQQRSYDGRIDQYTAATKEFNADDFANAEDKVKMIMSSGQQGIMVHALGSKLANLIVGLSKNNTELTKLAAIKDPTLFAVALGQLENKMKVTKRKPGSAPEIRLAASGGGGEGAGATANSTLEKLRDKAATTGDYTEILRYKRKMKEAGKKAG